MAEKNGLNGNLSAYIKYGSLIAALSIQTGIVLTRIDQMREEITETHKDLKEANATIRRMQLEQASRGTVSLEFNWRLRAIENRLTELSGPLERLPARQRRR